MLTIDRDGETFVFENRWDLLIPFTMEQYDGQELRATAIPKIAPIAREFLKKFASAPFSDAALDALWLRISPYEAVWGYEGGRYRWRRCRIFRLPKGTETPEPLPGTRLLAPEDERANRTTYHIAESLSAGLLCAGFFAGGELVSVAATHEPPAEHAPGSRLEVGVETVPGARGHGYAASCLSLLTHEILARGYLPEYRCTRSNRASAAVAARVGYRQAGEACYLLLRRVD